jgi:hypothetical protein
VLPSVGRPATEADSLKASAKLGQLLVKYGLTRHRDKGVWNGGAQVLTHLGFMIDTVRGVFGVPPTKLGKMEALARRLLRMERRNARRVPVADLASFIGRAQSLRLAVPDTAFRLKALYDSLHGQTDSDPGHGDYPGSSGVRASRHFSRHRVRISHPALRDFAYSRDLRGSQYHRPILPTPETPTATVHIDASMGTYGATLRSGAHGAGTRGHYEVQDFWSGEHRELAHVTIYELMTVRLTLQEFVEHCLLRQGEFIRLFTDNMVVMHMVQAMVSRSPLLMSELRRLRAFLDRCGISLQTHHLPSALNLYADRLSRRLKALELLPPVPQVPEYWLAGESEHDFGRSWTDVDLSSRRWNCGSWYLAKWPATRSVACCWSPVGCVRTGIRPSLRSALDIGFSCPIHHDQAAGGRPHS